MVGKSHGRSYDAISFCVVYHVGSLTVRKYSCPVWMQIVNYQRLSSLTTDDDG